ncbi:MAG TPA: DUF1616 domain-containing protein [Nitrososphaerales archaeon]|nr:DUF1616 domain-containing protein [Nitrososphaerales archaeon]
MDKETASIALVIIAILAVFAAISPLIQYNQENFSELGILGAQKTISGYPTTVGENQTFLLYAYVGNHEGYAEYYSLQVKLGNASTAISNSTSANLPVMQAYSYVLDSGGNVTFPMSLSINHVGTTQRLIFELWMFNTTSSSFTYTGLFNQIWINVTAS